MFSAAVLTTFLSFEITAHMVLFCYHGL
jgi:hypothetical protein